MNVNVGTVGHIDHRQGKSWLPKLIEESGAFNTADHTPPKGAENVVWFDEASEPDRTVTAEMVNGELMMVEEQGTPKGPETFTDEEWKKILEMESLEQDRIATAHLQAVVSQIKSIPRTEMTFKQKRSLAKCEKLLKKAYRRIKQ